MCNVVRHFDLVTAVSNAGCSASGGCNSLTHFILASEFSVSDLHDCDFCVYLLVFNLTNLTYEFFVLFSVLAATTAGTAATLGKFSVALTVRPGCSCSGCS
jgi:hypothetical protein